MTDREKREITALAVQRLKEIYPEAVCALEWGGNTQSPEEKRKNGWKLLIMGRLSAQCTDARVNIVCRELFAKYPTCQSVADASQEEIEEMIRPCGLFRTKAESIRLACRILSDKYDGIVPDDMDELLALPGVGRKIANLLLGDIYSKPAVVTDTHFMRICGRIGMYDESLHDPHGIEKIMSALIEPDEQSHFCHRIVQFGRDVCCARSPKCAECRLCDICRHNKGES